MYHHYSDLWILIQESLSPTRLNHLDDTLRADDLKSGGLVDISKHYNYLVIVDFEGTCDEPKNPDPQEVIEFPAIAIDISKQMITAEFHRYVRPLIHPILSEFCQQLTGIRQQMVYNQGSFAEVLAAFQGWLIDNKISKFIIITSGDWDMQYLFPLQCSIHNIAVPSWAKHWGNLKNLFSDSFPEYQNEYVRFSDMLTFLDMEFLGQRHSGIDDARNIARVVLQLLKNNGNFHSLIDDDYLPEHIKLDGPPEEVIAALFAELTPECVPRKFRRIELAILDIVKLNPELLIPYSQMKDEVIKEALLFIVKKLIKKGYTEEFLREIVDNSQLD